MTGQRIAVVGAGVSGLVAADRLSRHHQVTLFEAESRPGGHTHTVTVDAAEGPHRVDTGFIVFNPANYPRFTALLDELGIGSRPSEMSFSVRCDRTGVEWAGADSLNRVFGQRRNLVRPGFYRLLADLVRFAPAARAVAAEPDDHRTVGQFVAENRFGRSFVDHYLLPLGAALWSCPTGRFAEFPIRFVAEFLANHGMLEPLGARPQWRTVVGGSDRYVDALLARFPGGLRLGTPIRRVHRSEQEVVVARQDGGSECFDEVVLACHADQALGLLDRPTETEQKVLGAFPYEANEAVLHTDTSVLPRAQRTWAAWNYRRPAVGEDGVSVTYNMNILQGLAAREVYCVTLNEGGEVTSDRIIARMTYHHPLFTSERARAQARHPDLLRAHRTSFCGAYWGYGFHEDGVRSALAVADAFDPAKSREEAA
ncbi:NAD(P)/FAD-dependent oxidoreductase [Thiohalorhabdus sp.]|uniref:NAD(P)/FAD-dependent oxidoreductase n=1 Tax=Thiohalorhabdus sp. TaxID=3094134 RepID=UPI002FC352D2